ncbi:MAG: YCF48-related protein [Kofleriaceae bacterium]
MQLKSLCAFLFLGACALNNQAGDDMSGGGDDGGGGSDTGSGGGGGGGGGGPSGWQKIDLVDNGSVARKDLDLVSGILMTSATKGYVVSQAGHNSDDVGGAVYTLNGTTMKVVYDGTTESPGILGSVDFYGLEQTPNGIVAMAYADGIIRGDSSDKFTAQLDGGGEFGIEPIIGYKETSSGTTLVRQSGVVSVSPQSASSTATWTDVWAPEASEPIPANLPANECSGAPKGSGAPETRSSVYIGNGMIAYTSTPGNDDPTVCISTDGGHNFMASYLTVSDDVQDFTPSGVTFTSAQNGIVYFGSQSTSAYIQRTTDGGKTWKAVALPSDISSHNVNLTQAAFGPDGQNGYLVGYDYTKYTSLVLATTDGGQSWSTLSGFGDSKLYSAFVLDASHAWIGGDDGTLYSKK